MRLLSCKGNCVLLLCLYYHMLENHLNCTDASGGAVAATLGQRNDQQQEHPVAFASQKLSGSKLNWAIIEKEAYAIIWALNRFRDVVFGSHISVHCNHNPLQYIRECAPKSAKLCLPFKNLTLM